VARVVGDHGRGSSIAHHGFTGVIMDVSHGDTKGGETCPRPARSLPMPCQTQAQIAPFRIGLCPMDRDRNGTQIPVTEPRYDFQPWRLRTREQ
jgi:hypothetical protein